jgi:hypothetical protein
MISFPGKRKDFSTLMDSDLSRQMSRRSEPVQAEPLGVARHPQ